MDFHQFHNGLRVLLNIDADEFLQATFGIDTKPADNSREWGVWTSFRDNPYRWFIRAPTDKAKAVFAIIEQRSEALKHRHKNGAPMFTADGTMLDDQGNRSIFDDIEEGESP